MLRSKAIFLCLTLLAIAFCNVNALGATDTTVDAAKSVNTSQAANTDLKGKSYAEYPGIPDFAKFTASQFVLKNETAFGYTYIYNTNDVTDDEFLGYITALEQCGYVFNEDASDILTTYHCLSLKTYIQTLAYDGKELSVYLEFNGLQNRLLVDIMDVDATAYVALVKEMTPEIVVEHIKIDEPVALENALGFIVTDMIVANDSGTKYLLVKLDLGTLGLGNGEPIYLSQNDFYMDAIDKSTGDYDTRYAEFISCDGDRYEFPFKMNLKEPYKILLGFELRPGDTYVAFVASNKLNDQFVGMPRALYYDLQTGEYE